MSHTTYTTTLLQKIQLTPDVIELRFQKPADFTYVAGQFIQIQLEKDGKNVRRSYSLSSTPNDPYIECCIKVLPNGIGSTYLHSLSEGDTLTFRGPFGHFSTQNTYTDPIYSIATGVGVAPIMGIITDELLHKKNTRPIHVLFGVRNESDIFWLERLETFKRDYANFSYTLSLSQPSPTWGTHAGRVTAHLRDVVVQQHFFICGSLPMVKDVRAILLEKNVQPEYIHVEIF